MPLLPLRVPHRSGLRAILRGGCSGKCRGQVQHREAQEEGTSKAMPVDGGSSRSGKLIRFIP